MQDHIEAPSVPALSWEADIPSPALRVTTQTAQRIAVPALGLGVMGDLLLREGVGGPGMILWSLLLGLSLTAVTWKERRNMSRECALWLVSATMFAIMLAWRESEVIRVLDFPACAGSLAFAAMSSRERTTALFATRVRDALRSLKEVILVTAAGIIPVLLRLNSNTSSMREPWLDRARPAVRGFIIASALVLVFGTLLGSADPIFASFFSLRGLDADVLVSHIVLMTVLASLAAGWHRAALDEVPARASVSVPWAFRKSDVGTALGTLNVLFAGFVLSQLSYFFGGDAYLASRTGLTAAEYARHGFFEMTFIVALVIPILLATRAMLEPRADVERLHTRLATPVIGLLLCIVGAAFARMRLYVEYFGFTTDRVNTMIFMVWLAAVLLCVCFTVLRGSSRRFVQFTLASGLSVLALVNLVSPDIVVAKANVARAKTTANHALDLQNLASLSGEATAIAVREAIAPSRLAAGSAARIAQDAQRCSAAHSLLVRWRELPGTATWRSWNYGESAAELVVMQNSSALFRTIHATCRAVKTAKP